MMARFYVAKVQSGLLSSAGLLLLLLAFRLEPSASASLLSQHSDVIEMTAGDAG